MSFIEWITGKKRPYTRKFLERKRKRIWKQLHEISPLFSELLFHGYQHLTLCSYYKNTSICVAIDVREDERLLEQRALKAIKQYKKENQV